METDEPENQTNNNGERDSQPENQSTPMALISGMDSSCSIGASSKDATANDLRKSNISELVGKSKKAAFSLWTLLHAKNCKLGPDRCSHPGCSEAKLMFLHHKTCCAKSVEPCPTQHKGCQDARKLLAHYRRCREIRARQSQNLNGRSRQQHVCLVCSLVARHAKFTLDRCVSTASKNGTGSHYIPSLNLSYDTYNGKRNRSQSVAAYSSSSIQEQPRFAFSRRPNGSSDGISGFHALQAAVSSALNSNTSHSTKGAKKAFGGKTNRPRAESLDVRKCQQKMPIKKNRSEEKNMSYLYLAAVDNFSDDLTEETPKKNHSTGRRRSLSCTIPSVSNRDRKSVV